MVAPIDVDQAHEAQFLRIALECEVSRTIALDPAAHDLGTPERLLEAMHRAWDREDRPTFIASDLDYHRAMFRTTGHEGLWELVKQRSGNVDRLRNLHLPTPGKAAQILADHHAHLDALRAGDEVEAQAVIRRHLTGTLRAANEIREAHRRFFY
jgi:DNA-binding GntR family transcriptional regulator